MSDIQTEPVTLDTPIVRGETTVSQVLVRKPGAGELKGVSLINLLQMDVNALITVLPRVTVPTLLQHEVAALDPADLMQLGTEVVGFLMTRSTRSLASQSL